MPEVQKFLSERHNLHFWVYNLCSERDYDPVKFDYCVSRFPFYVRASARACANSSSLPRRVPRSRDAASSPLSFVPTHDAGCESAQVVCVCVCPCACCV